MGTKISTPPRSAPQPRVLMDQVHIPLSSLCGLLRLLSTSSFHECHTDLQRAALFHLADLAEDILGTLDTWYAGDEGGQDGGAV
jgi:hypothetical protein